MTNCTAEVLAQFDDVREFDTWELAEPMGILWLTLLSIWFLTPLPLLVLRRKLFPIVLKPVLLIVMFGCGIWFYAFTIFGRAAIGRENFSCDALLWARVLLIPSVGGPFVVALANLYSRIELATAMQAFRVGTEEMRLDQLVAKITAASVKRQALLLALVFTPAIVYIVPRYVTSPIYGEGCTGCDRDADDEIINSVFTISMFVIGIAVYWRMRHFDDPLGLRRELARVMLVGVVSIIAFGVLDEIPAVRDLAERDAFHVAWTALLACAYAHFVFCWRPIYRSYQRKNVVIQQQRQRRTQLANKTLRKKKTRQSDPGFVMTSTEQPGTSSYGSEEVGLAQVLATSAGLELFQHYLAGEFSVESLLFYKSAKEWRKHYEETPTSARNTVATNIFLAFVAEGAPMEINVKSETRRALMHKFNFKMSSKDFGAAIEPEIFDVAVSEVFVLMEADAFQRFRDTRAFKSFNARL